MKYVELIEDRLPYDLKSVEKMTDNVTINVKFVSKLYSDEKGPEPSSKPD